MSRPIEFCLNRATEAEIAEHLWHCDAEFVPRLSGRVEVAAYAHKIAEKATRFEGWTGGVMVGLLAAYCSGGEHGAAYITSVSVRREWRGRGIASQLLERCIGYAKGRGFERIRLEVDQANTAAMKLYEKKGFIVDKVDLQATVMCLNIGKAA